MQIKDCKIHLIVIISYILLAFAAFRHLLLTPGVIGHNWDWNIPSINSLLKFISDNALFLWKEFSLGMPISLGIPNLIYNKILFGTGYLGFDGELLTKTILLFVSVTAATCMFLLTRALLGNNGNGVNYSSFLAGLFYGFSPFLFNEFIGGSNVQFVTYAVTPLAVLLFVKFDETGKFIFLFACTLVLTFITISLQHLGLVSFILLSYAVSKKRIFVALQYMAKLYMLYALINVYWILPTFSDILGLKAIALGKEALFDEYNIINAVPSVEQAFKGTGYFRPFFTWTIDSPLYGIWNLVTNVTVILIVIFTLRHKERDKGLFWITLFLISLIFVTGGKPPFRTLVLWLYHHVPIMNLFRSPQHFILLSTITLSILIAIASSTFLSVFNSTRIKVGMLFILFFWLHPFFSTGDLGSLKLRDRYDPGNFLDVYRIPPGYEDMISFLEKDKGDYRVLYLPMAGSPYFLGTKYQHEAQAGDPLVTDSPRPTLTADFAWSPAAKIIGTILEDSIYETTDYQQVKDILDLLSVKYIILRKDVLPHFGHGKDTWDYETVKKYLSEFPQLLKLKEYDCLELYLNKTFRDRIYPSLVRSTTVGSIRALVPFTYTSHLNKYRSLAFVEEQYKHIFLPFFKSPLPPINSQTRALTSNIIFANSHPYELILHLVRAEQITDKDNFTINIRKPGAVQLDRRSRAKLHVKEDGCYSVWIRRSSLIHLGSLVNLLGKEFLHIAKMRFPLPIVDKTDTLRGFSEWVKLADVNLEKGDYPVNVVTEKNRPPQIRSVSEIVFISEEKFNEWKNIYTDKQISFLFYVDSHEAERISSSIKESYDTNDYKNPFCLSTREFFVPKRDDYTAVVYIKPKRTFLSEEEPVIKTTIASTKGSPESLLGWNIYSENVLFKQHLSEEGLEIEAYFEKDDAVEETIILSKQFSHLKLKDNPYLIFTYSLQSRHIQDATLTVWFKEEKNNNVRGSIHLFPIDGIPYFNLYEQAKEIYGRNAAGKLYIHKIEIKFRKAPVARYKYSWWGKKEKWVDASISNVKGFYTFILKDITFLNYIPLLAEFQQEMSAFTTVGPIYYSDKKWVLTTARFVEEIPQYVKNVYLSRKSGAIDLKEQPILTFSLPVDEFQYKFKYKMGKGARNFPSRFKVLLTLDFDGDQKRDAETEVFSPAAPKANNKIYIRIKALEEVKRRFPDKSHYNLLGLGISHHDNRGFVYQLLASQTLVKCKEHICDSSEFNTDSDVLMVDGKTYKLPKDFTKYKHDGHYTIECGSITLEKGNHTIEAIDNERFKVEMVELRPASVQSPSVYNEELPKIAFRKINPTRYVVDVNDVNGPFTLVFCEGFHEGWKAYLRREPNKKQEPWSALLSAWKDRNNKIAIKDHYVVNGYANAWAVPAIQSVLRGTAQDSDTEKKNANEENFQVIIEYLPQRFLELGLLISTFALLGCIGYLGYNRSG